MAWFRCMVGGGNALELIVTCSSQFAGQTITCTDGISTLTATCPSSSPYEITFKLPNYGTWTVSGTTGGQSYSESIVVQPYDVELIAQIDITVDVYSAANDTVSYTGLDGQTHTITTDSSGHATATITIDGHGSSITFNSSVAKDVSDMSTAYSKTIALTAETSKIFIMPDGIIVYWYGYIPKTLTKYDYYSSAYYANQVTVTYNTNYLSLRTISQYQGPLVLVKQEEYTAAELNNLSKVTIIQKVTSGAVLTDRNAMLSSVNGAQQADPSGVNPDPYMLGTLSNRTAQTINGYGVVKADYSYTGSVDGYALYVQTLQINTVGAGYDVYACYFEE